MSKRIALIGLVIAATALAACSSSEGSAEADDGTSTTAVVDAASDEAADSSTEANVLAAEARAQWTLLARVVDGRRLLQQLRDDDQQSCRWCVCV